MADLVINELMVSNRTGLVKDDTRPADWIEIRNNGKDSVNLEGYRLSVSKDKTKEWVFPSVGIGAGKCLVVFAEKHKDSAPGKSLQADFNLPKSGAVVKLLAPNDTILSEVKYSQMEPDQSLARQSDGTYRSTFWQSPGFDNNRQGNELAVRKIDSLRQSPVLIWELMSRAGHTYEHWVELKNVSDKPVDLSSYRLSKKMGKDEGWALPAKSLEPGGIISFQLAGGKRGKNGSQMAPFKLGDKETVVLTKDGRFMDGMCARLTPYGGSVGRLKDARGLFYFSKPTRNAENTSEGFRYIAENPEWNHKPGIYKDKEEITLKPKNSGRKIHYTLDGSEPTMSSPVLKDSILITKPTVVRSFAEGDSVTMRSNIATATYLPGVDHDVPVINISVNNGDLYDHNRGIYADGPGRGDEFPYPGANFWKNWTKKAHVEMFDGGEGVSSDCGLKIFGGYSRAEAKKSFRIKFRGEFGNANVNYDFFGTGQPLEMEDLVLRSGSQDYRRYMIKDEFFTSLAQSGSPTLLTQMYRPVALYINAQYFGLYYLREKIDKNFVARKLDLPNDSIDVFLSGPSPYMALVNRISGMDMRKSENFELARQNFDLQGLIDYKIGNIFAGKTDVGNIRYARSRHKDSDRKWRFVFYDIDASWSPNSPSAAFFLSTSANINPEKARHNVLINRLLQNNEFRKMFLERLSYHLANTYSAKNTTAYFDKFIAGIRNEMKHNCKRWTGLSYEKWENNIKSFRARLEDRPQIILNDLRRYLAVTDEENKKYFASLGY